MSRSLNFNFMYMLIATIEKSSPFLTFLLLQECRMRWHQSKDLQRFI